MSMLVPAVRSRTASTLEILELSDNFRPPEINPQNKYLYSGNEYIQPWD